MLPDKVTLVEVGPRDGLQNESTMIPVRVKIQLIELLADAGLTVIEATSFVSAKWVPQMADASLLMQQLIQRSNIRYPVLTPNIKGFEQAIASGAKEIAIFAAASELFSQKNINCGVEESLNRFGPVLSAAKAMKIPVRGYISCVLGCPYQGSIMPEKVADIAEKLHQMGCYEISLGDTIGKGNPASAQRLIEAVSARIPIEQIAVHFHDTYGQALANIFAVLNQGISTIDTAVAGLGGCPYAKGASGNVASEDVVFMLDGMGIETGIDLNKLVIAGEMISKHLGRPLSSKVGSAMIASR